MQRRKNPLMIIPTHKTRWIVCLAAFVTILNLAGCTNTPDGVIVRESETAFVDMLNQTSTALSIPPTETFTELPPTAEFTATVRVLPTQLRYPAPTATAAATVAAVVPAAGAAGNKAELISMVPNNQQTARVSQAFQLTFTLKNTGTTVWTPNYKVVHVGGTKMSATDAASLNGNVGNGQTGTATFYMTAPKDKGTYTQNFNFIDPWNAVILPLSLTIVAGDSGTIPQVGTLTPTITVTRTGTPMGHFEYMCSDPARSIQQGQGCDTFCQVSFPQRLNCYVMGVLNPTATSTIAATPTPNLALTQAVAATQTAMSDLIGTQTAVAAAAQSVAATETAIAQQFSQQTAAAQAQIDAQQTAQALQQTQTAEAGNSRDRKSTRLNSSHLR